ncbi:unnamed protein product [Discula destructiva]
MKSPASEQFLPSPHELASETPKAPSRDNPSPRSKGSPSPQGLVPDDGTLKQSWSGRRFARDSLGNRSPSISSLQIQMPMPFVTPGQLAFSAMHFLPVPVLVLNSLKTVVLANEAMGRLLGLIPENDTGSEESSRILDSLNGQTLSQVGVDMMQAGRPVWVAWESFFQSMVDDMGTCNAQGSPGPPQQHSNPSLEHEDMTPTHELPVSEDKGRSAQCHQTVVEVVVARHSLQKAALDPRAPTAKRADDQLSAKMIISVWDIADHQTYFTLTFTNTESELQSSSKRKPIARSTALDAAEKKTIATASNPSSMASSHGSSSSHSYRMSPNSVSLSSSPFPPLGAPFKSMQSAPSILQKMTIIKDTLLDNTETPIIAMWRDCTVAYPNAACRRIMRQDPSYSSNERVDILRNWIVYSEDFSRVLEPQEYPIAVLLDTKNPYSGMRIGTILQDGTRVVYDVLGEVICDDETGEFLAGVVTCRDITKMAREIDQMKVRDLERFKMICDIIPQLVWSTDKDGSLEFFNTRWTEYTGMSLEESLGVYQWTRCFHPDDMAETKKRWEHSLRTGDPYVVEYRCRTKEGKWRWMLGQALPLRNSDTGKIEKWIGTCTDVHDSIEAKLAARRTRQQLLSVIAHAHVTIFTVDTQRKITMLEGALIENANMDQLSEDSCLGGNVDDVFNRLHPELPEGQRPDFLAAVDAIIDRKSSDALVEHSINDRYFRTRFLPMMGRKPISNEKSDENTAEPADNEVEGVIGIIMDVTEVKAKEAVLEAQAKEKQQLLANEAAAKEASRLKSQFLANMSHEIRTPITGVIGMAELLLDVDLDEEQREYAENIYRSGNALLTVINDILDFSKVESGRLDIEEVQFSMSVIVRDVAKMLSFAAQRKNLEFISDIAPEVEEDLVVLGDPGRVRQIITNLLTNSIKFTHQGFVKLSVTKEKETEDKIVLRFEVQDTGIGIDDAIRKRLFQPFSQGDASTARKFGGTGLGLTICKSLLDLMHGRMSLDSVVNQGTTATFWLPFNKPLDTQPSNLVKIEGLPGRLQSEMSVSCNSSERDGHGTPPISGEFASSSLEKVKPSPTKLRASILRDDVDLSPEARSKIHVLVVEDNAINQQIATKTIKKLGFNVSASWNGREALEYLAAAKEGQHQKPDIILMDVQMPICDGYKATHLLRHHFPYKSYIRDVPIVAMTASAIQGDQEKCRRAGMDDYLAKPVRSKTLEQMLVRWSVNRRALSTHRPHKSDSVCTDSSDDCTNSGIPCVGIDQVEDDGELPTPHERLAASALDLEEQRNSLPTPRPSKVSPVIPSSASRSFFSSHDAFSSAPEPPSSPAAPQIHRVETDELAQQSRDDKLLGAAGGGPSVSPMAHTPSMEKGEALTEANVEKFQREERRRRMSSSG